MDYEWHRSLTKQTVPGIKHSMAQCVAMTKTRYTEGRDDCIITWFVRGRMWVVRGDESYICIRKCMQPACPVRTLLRFIHRPTQLPVFSSHQRCSFAIHCHTEYVSLPLHWWDACIGQRCQGPPSHHPEHSKWKESSDLFGRAQGHLWYKMDNNFDRYPDQWAEEGLVSQAQP